MRLELKLLIVLTLLIFPVVANAQLRAKCEVRPLWVGGGARSANLGVIGTLDLDTYTYTRAFKDEYTPQIATVAIRFDEEISKAKLHRVQIAISVSDKEETNIFESVNSSEASTQYRKGWNLAVTRNVNFEKVVYMFTFHCWDAAGKQPWL